MSTRYLSDAELDVVTGGGYLSFTNINIDKNVALVSQSATNVNIAALTFHQSATNVASVTQIA